MRVAIIPARGGSRRIPRKNIRSFHGKPIIAYSIEAARESGLFDRIFVSSDDREIRKIARQHGAEAIEREMRYAMDDVGTQEVTRDALVELGLLGIKPEHACCIYPCVPMLTAADLRVGLEIFCTPYRYVYVTGWFYWGDVRDFGENPALEASFEMDRLVGARWIDINTEDDWRRAEEMYASLHNESSTKRREA